MAATVEDIRRHLREILGTDAKASFPDEVIRKHIRNYQGRPDVIACALESLCEDYYEESNRFLNDHLPEFALPDSQSQRGPTEFFQNPFKRKKSSSSSGPMGCGSSYEPSQAPAVHCDLCGKSFSFISRKRTCADCSNIFCCSCLPAKGARCSRCGVLNQKPPHRGELMKLRVKDLQHFLTRKRINIKSCVEKKDLVELVLQHSGVPSPAEDSSTTRTTWEEGGIRVSDQIPLERRGTFPQNYVESNHRREWFQEKFGNETEVEACDETTPVEDISPRDPGTITSTTTPVLPMEPNSEDEVMSVEVVDEDEEEGEEPETDVTSDNKQTSEETEARQAEAETEAEVEVEVEGAVGGVSVTDSNTEQPETSFLKQSFDHLSDKVSSSSLPGSPRRFANHGLVYLSEIESLEDLKELSTKQIKEMLAMNRVNFKGCVEKEELLKILQRLWKQEQKNKDNVESMEDESLCKICMDSPIDCVMLECGHMCTCTNCGKQMAECPICRQYVVRVVKTFKA